MKRILLVDDNRTIHRLAELTFADEGIEVLSASRGDAALEQLSRDDVSLVLADVSAPGICGYDLCAAIKQNEALKSLPVVLLIGASETFDLDRVAASGADATLTKPLDPSALVELVQSLLRRTAESSPPARHVQEDFTRFLLNGKQNQKAEAGLVSPTIPGDRRTNESSPCSQQPARQDDSFFPRPSGSADAGLAAFASSSVDVEWPSDEGLEEIVPVAVFDVPVSDAVVASAAVGGTSRTAGLSADGSAILPFITANDIPGLRNLEVPRSHTIEQKRVEETGEEAGERYSVMLNDLVNRIVSRVISQIEPDLKRLVRDSLQEIAGQGLKAK